MEGSSQLEQIDAKNCQELLDAGGDSEKRQAYGFECLTSGFANHVWSVASSGGKKRLVVKSYTDLMLLRIEAHAVGAVDELAGRCGVGPVVHLSNQTGLVMDFLPGRTLEEVDVHRGNLAMLEGVAKMLSKLHSQKVPAACEGEPMLWRTMEKMMLVAKQTPELLPAGIPSMEVIDQEIAAAKTALERHRPKIVLGHGDFKPSNVLEHNGEVKLIDFELGGPNYRGFDWMKLFRTAGDFSEESMRLFLRAYAESAGESCSLEDLEALLQETQVFEPLTWLEAFVFFLALPQFKSDELPRWHKLAEHRWSMYQESRARLFEMRHSAND
ncbi:unnamed protein product [Polarella glacialis]|uniref:ethanolamine kinase n=1 Tax=Polarella glacialis TaxID=89957 RepID=A0A813LYF9_POLGL|nr:unnamed protein product [Polarella glacialis]CAE8741309.1 unnamed protein product [Polarella glacialis]|mmetsp:Transcript_11957/g.18869  ORF Transcript_11957/g.18869 Transcript_11957/m.18869 type:complete len:327 (-) Transcript_11957:56-1036(-)